jgi:hypothetical protein
MEERNDERGARLKGSGKLGNHRRPAGLYYGNRLVRP